MNSPSESSLSSLMLKPFDSSFSRRLSGILSLLSKPFTYER